MHTVKTRRTFLQELTFLACAATGMTFFKSHLQPSGLFRIGYLSGAGYPQLEAAFTEELHKLGFSEGQNIFIERRFSRPNSADTIVMAAELARMDLALIVAGALPFALEVRKANPAMPMVIATCPGMVSNGFAQSPERPGGIYTGMDELPPGVTSKRLRLLKTAAPTVTRIALLSTTPGRGGHETQLSEAEQTAAELGIEVKSYRAASLAELEKALANLVADGMNGLLSFQGGLGLSNRQLIVDFVAQQRIPAVYQATLFAEAGGLMAWAPDLVQQYREAAHFVEKISKGAKPGDLPVRQPAQYYLTVNTSAAKKIGLTFPKELLAQATQVLP